MGSKIGKLAKLAGVYALGDIISRAAAFLLLPLYTRYLSPAEYGVVAITEMIRQVLIILLSFGMMSAILRFYYQLDSAEERRRFYGTMWLFLIVVPGVIIAPLSMWGAPLFRTLFTGIDFETYIRPVLWSIYLNVAFATLPPYLFRAREQAVYYVGFNLATFGLTACFTVWFVVFRGEGSLGYIHAQLIVAAILALVSAMILWREVSFAFDANLLRPMLIYSLPLIPHFLSHWALNLSDRAILERFVGLGELGLYALGYQIALAFNMLTTAIINALTPTFSRAAKNDDDLRALPQITTYYVLLVVFLALAFCLTAKDVVIIIAAEAYYAAGAIVPWVVVGFLALSIYYIPMNLVSMVVGKTLFIPIFTLLAAGLNITLNIVFIPQFGIQAAAVNTLIGYLALAVMVFVYAQRIRPLPYEYARLLKVAVAAVLIAIAGFALLHYAPLTNLIISSILLLGFPLTLTLLGFWKPQEIAVFMSWKQYTSLLARK